MNCASRIFVTQETNKKICLRLAGNSVKCLKLILWYTVKYLSTTSFFVGAGMVVVVFFLCCHEKRTFAHIFVPCEHPINVADSKTKRQGGTLFVCLRVF